MDPAGKTAHRANGEAAFLGIFEQQPEIEFLEGNKRKVSAGDDRKPGRKVGFRKANAMTGRLAMRVPQELEDWLQEEGAKRGLGIGDMGRMLLMEIMHARRSADPSGE